MPPEILDFLVKGLEAVFQIFVHAIPLDYSMMIKHEIHEKDTVFDFIS